MKKYSLLLLIFSFFLFSACSTDLVVVGNYKETMVIYGLLDQTQKKQYIRVNKAFLGEGNAMVFATEKDSIQFVNALDVRLKQLPDGKEYILKPDNSIQKDPGLFYSGDQTNAIYSFASDGIDSLKVNSKYTLSVTNTSTGTTATATTSLVRNFSMTCDGFFQFTPNNEDSRFFSEWTSTRTAKMYQLITRLYYDDYVTINGVQKTVGKTLDWAFPAHTTTGNDREKMGNDFSHAEYLQFIGSNLSTYPELNYRKVKAMSVIIVAGGEEITTYIEVNKPSTSIVQDKPIYTNIENGYGVFSGRYYRPEYQVALSLGSKDLDSLTCGRFTSKLKFLSADGTFPPCF